MCKQSLQPITNREDCHDEFALEDRDAGRGGDNRAGRRFRFGGGMLRSCRHGTRPWRSDGREPGRRRRFRAAALAFRSASGCRRPLALCLDAGILPRGSDAATQRRQRHQVRSLAAGGELERQVRRYRQRHLGRADQPFANGRSAQARLRGGQHRHRPYRQWHDCRIRHRPPGKAGRFRPPRSARDGGVRQAGDRCLLRQRAAHLAVEFLLHRRKAGGDERLSLSRRFRRDQRHGPGQPDDRSDDPVDVGRLAAAAHVERSSLGAAARQRASGGRQAVRQARRDRGWNHRPAASHRL